MYPRSRSGLEPTACSSEKGCDYGYRFFTAPSDSYIFNGKPGYGDILIQGIEVKYYHDAIYLAGKADRPMRTVKIENNLFYKIGEVANNGPFDDASLPSP